MFILLSYNQINASDYTKKSDSNIGESLNIQTALIKTQKWFFATGSIGHGYPWYNYYQTGQNYDPAKIQISDYFEHLLDFSFLRELFLPEAFDHLIQL